MKRLINIELTTKCYANCMMCPRQSIKEHGYITMNNINNIVNYAKKQKLFEISLSGRGEPTLHPDIVPIVKNLQCINIPIPIVTTTDGMNETNYKDIMDNIDKLRISVSSIKKETFKKIHRGLDYEKTWEMIERIVSYNPRKVYIHLVGGEIIYDGIEETIEYFKERHVEKIFLFPLWNRAGNLKNNEENRRKKLINKYHIQYSEDEYMDKEKVNRLNQPNYCPIGDSSIMINFKGELIGCFQDFTNTVVVGSIDGDDNIELLQKKIKLLGNMPICRQCNTKKVINSEY